MRLEDAIFSQACGLAAEYLAVLFAAFLDLGPTEGRKHAQQPSCRPQRHSPAAVSRLFFKNRKTGSTQETPATSVLQAPYNNHGALQRIRFSPAQPIHCARPRVNRCCTAASVRFAITKYPPCRRWRLLRPRGRCGNRSDCTGHRQQPRKHANT